MDPYTRTNRPCQSQSSTVQSALSPSPVPRPKSPMEAQNEYYDERYHQPLSRSNTKHSHPHIDMRRLREHAPALQQQTELPRCMALQARRLIDHDRIQQTLSANLFDQGRLLLERIHTFAEDP